MSIISVLKPKWKHRKRADLEKNKKSAKVFWKNFVRKFPAADDLEQELTNHVKKWKTLSFTKKSKIADLLVKSCYDEKIRSEKRVTPNYNSRNNPKV